MKKILLSLSLFLCAFASSQAQPAITVKLNAADASGVATLDVLLKEDGKVVTKLYQLDEGVLDILNNGAPTGDVLELTPKSFNVKVSDLRPGETLKIKSLKLTDLSNFSSVYISDTELPIAAK